MQNQYGNRAEDKGRDSLEVIMARIEERLTNALDRQDAHAHSNKNDFAEIRARLEIETDKIRKQADTDRNKTDAIQRFVYIAIGAISIINLLAVPIIINLLIKRLNSTATITSLILHHTREI